MNHNHTFLFQPGSWRAKGFYYDENENAYPLKGEAIISHETKIWHNRCLMQVEDIGSGLNINNDYLITPFESRKKITTWTSNDSESGKYNGKIVIAGDAIFSHFESEDGCCYGSEVLIMLSETKYLSRGYMIRDNNPASSWVTELNRK